MAHLRLGPFGSISPRTAERMLPDDGAQTAENVNLLSGELRPIKTPLTVTAVGAGKLAVYRAEYGGAETWRGWATDVDVARVPLSVSVEARYCWTGDGPPKWSKFTDFGTVASDLTLGISNPQTAPGVGASGGVGAAVSRLYVYTFYSVDGEESGPSPASALVTGKVDDTWAITMIDAVPTNAATIVAMPAAFFVSPTNTFANATSLAVGITSSTSASPSVITRVAHGYVTDDRILITGHATNTAINNTPTNPTWRVVRITADTYSLKTEAGVAVDGNGVGGATGSSYKCSYHWLRAGTQITTSLSATSYTVATTPSAYSFTVTSTTDLHTATSWTRVANWNTASMKRRLYRSTGSTTNATYQLVTTDTGGTTYNDIILDANIPGDELISATWAPPPVDLIAIHALPNGAMVGLTTTLLCYSEPYQPHAWPPEYQYGLIQDGVGLETFGTTVVVGTLGAPYIADGVEPESVTLQRMDSVWPCVAKRSMVSLGDGVAYATTHGMVYLGANGPSLWTQPFYTREDWDALTPSTMVSAAAEGKVFVRYLASGSSTAAILLFIPSEPHAALTTLGIECQELYADSRDGHLYIVDLVAVKRYDAGVGVRLSYTWLSKEFNLPDPVNFGAARVEIVSENTAADTAAAEAAYDAAVAAQVAKIANGAGALNGGVGVTTVWPGQLNGSAVNGYTPPLPPVVDAAAVAFTLYSNGVSVFSTTLFDSTPFRLPAGYLSDAYSVKLNGTARVKNVKIAETPDGLRQI